MDSEVVYLLSWQEVGKMRQAGRIAAELLSYLQPMIQAGISTGEIDRAALQWAQAREIITPMLGCGGFPRAICTSVNEVVCNGIPTTRQILKDGDIINLTVAVLFKKYHGKTSQTFFVGTPSPTAKK